MTRSTLALLISSTVMLSACGGGSSSDSTPPAPTPTNSAPTDITLSSASVDENAPAAVIGELSAVDADSGDSFTFTTSNNAFVISGNSLSLAAAMVMDFEQAETAEVEVSVTDAAGASFSKTLTISVNDLMDSYQFTSKYDDTSASSVSYGGQTTRHVLIAELNAYIANDLENDAEAGTLVSRDAVLAKLNSYFLVENYDLVADDFAVNLVANSEQTNLRALSSSDKNLIGKIAGNDASGQHKDWNNGDFVGWGAAGSTTPQGLVEALFAELADNTAEVIAGQVRQDAAGNPLPVYVSSNGRDLKQLLQKFLLMAVAYSQGADDYLDFDTEGKGLLTDNTMNVDGKSYTNLEHQFDEGFGYFGAARDYLDYSDQEIAAKGGRDGWSQGYFDTSGNGSIDLFSEYNFGQAVNAAKRDLGATVPTHYTTQAMTAFIAGRQLIANTQGALSDAQMTELQGHALDALDAWERSIAATVVHYINDTSNDLNSYGTEAFSFTDLAKHWSELKGFGLGLQFNRHSPLSDADFAQFQQLVGDAPVFANDNDRAAYLADLQSARDLLQNAYGFNAENVANW
ncbi:DUF4856 domain-containing protein [Ferrimonas senticii]|uniref:DUF4856 domain-containing protein n=1 Tax=Ferrimonas senticii TaxID=394566 RepID=UPI0003F51C0F|nr:DUF4856 domain-containing protein [Ferrimonas senticii]